ncbi:CinA family protein [Salinisphaera sp.]|uniref:CinA family protein n=1 Tax=Salinisphaera sp. TaxID=1914330 RepID=UPI002D77F939|nr:CinA family protein [Salinisphaera sp.]HET7312780.1 CinA family protein [Salinisphaera sp.]
MEELEDIVNFLLRHEVTLATAESCTAGLVVSELARVPGSGQAIDCGLTVYSPQAKTRHLGIEPELLEKHGLTSEIVADAMAVGAIRHSHANAAIANTGIAGPAPGPRGVPPGTVCFGWAIVTDDTIRRLTETRWFAGGRNKVRLAAAHYALRRLVSYYAEAAGGWQA